MPRGRRAQQQQQQQRQQRQQQPEEEEEEELQWPPSTKEKFLQAGRKNVDALIDAAWDGNFEQLALLLAGERANPHWPHSRSFWVPLAAACKQKPSKLRAPLVSALLDAQADPNVWAHTAALQTACEDAPDDLNDGLACVRLLLSAKAEVNVVSVESDSDPTTPLYAAAWNGCTGYIRLLLDAAADPNLSTAHESVPKARVCTALAVSCEKVHIECVRMLLRARADVEGGITGGDSLQRIVVDIKKPSPLGLTPLMLAVSHAHMDVVTVMLEAGASVNAANIQGLTALHIIGGYGGSGFVGSGGGHSFSIGSGSDGGYITEDLVRLLVDNGASLEAVDHWGRTPLDLARVHRRAANVGILLEAAGNPAIPASGDAESEVLQEVLEAGIKLPEMSRVRIVSVTSRPELNDTEGTLIAWHPTGDEWVEGEDGSSCRGDGRWAVRCELDGINRKLRADNLQLLLPPVEDTECVICMDAMPRCLSIRTHDVQPTICCGQLICGKCAREHERTQAARTEGNLCAYCRQPEPGDDKTGLAYMSTRAARGEAHALFTLASVYLHGSGSVVKPNPQRAAHYLQRAVEAGEVAAQVELGAHLCGLIGQCPCGHEPYDIPADAEEGAKLLEAAAAQGAARAYYMLMRLLSKQTGESDPTLSQLFVMISHLRRADELGDPDAAIKLKAMQAGTSMHDVDSTHEADHALGNAIESGDMDMLRQAIEEHQGAASHDVLEKARRVREKWKKRARKQKS